MAALAVGIVGSVVPLALAEQIEVDEGTERVDLAAELGEAGRGVAVAGAPSHAGVDDVAQHHPRWTSRPAPPE